MQSLDIENRDKRYLDEKELFILYRLLRKRHISTLWSNAFTPNQKVTLFPKPTNIAEIATLEEDINNHIQRETERTKSLMGSPFVLSYLLDIGRLFDAENFSLSGNADYSLVEGGFLSYCAQHIMEEYLKDTPENRKNDDEYGDLTKKQIDFLDNIISCKDNNLNNKILFTELANPPIREYENAILKKGADDDFIELINKLIKEYDGGKWNTKDAEKFLEIYYRHNKKQFNKNTLTEKTAFYKDDQTKLAELIFEYTDFHLSIKETDTLQFFLDKYIDLFTDDDLSGRSGKGLTGTFFSEGLLLPLNTQFFGYKKQRDIILRHIKNIYREYQRNDLEIGHPFFELEYIGDKKPNTAEIEIKTRDRKSDLLLFVHTMISLEREGYFQITDFSYGPKQLFDMYDRGYLFRVILKRDIEAIEIQQKTKNTKPLSFDNKTKILSFLEHEIIISQRAENDASELLATIFKDKNRIWNADEVLDDWSFSTKKSAVPKQKVYQAGKAVNRIIAQETKIKDFLFVTTKTVSINPKYLES